MQAGRPSRSNPTSCLQPGRNRANTRSWAHVWKQAAIELEDAEYIVVIGYSCPESDAFFRYLYALGTSGLRRLKRFVVIDPGSEIEGRFRGMLGQDVARRLAYYPFVFSGAMAAIKSELGLS